MLGDLAILRAADRVDADLVVMATRPARGGCGLFLGGLVENVVHCSHRPVVCVPADAGRVTAPYRRIIVPTDLSPVSLKALPMAAVLAQAFDARVIGVHVVGRRVLSSTAGMRPTRTTLEGLVARFLRSGLPGLVVEGRVYETSAAAWEGIVDAAREEEASMIVMSTAGHDSACDRWLGNNAEHVLRRTSCPVLILGPANAGTLQRSAA